MADGLELPRAITFGKAGGSALTREYRGWRTMYVTALGDSLELRRRGCGRPAITGSFSPVGRSTVR